VNLRRDVTNALVSEGFIRGKRVHRKPLDDEWSLIVDTGEIGRATDIAPYAGLRCASVERLLLDLCQLPPSQDTSTVGANVGYVLGGEYRSWLPLPGGPAVTVDEVLTTVHAALDRLAGYRSIDLLPAAWDAIADSRLDPSHAYRRVIVQRLAGDEAGLQRELAAAEDTYCFRDDEICADFKAFRERLQRI
jgi:hypothetical protein